MSGSTVEAPRASIAVLGPLDVRFGSDPIPLTGERSRRILATLVDGGAAGVTVDRLAELIWDDTDRPLEPTAHVRTAISRLRRQLADSGADGAAVVESIPGGYRLADGVDVDAWMFESAVREASSVVSPRQHLDRLDQALEHWRGEPFSGFEDIVELAPGVTRMVELRLDAEEERLTLLLELGEVQRAAVRARLLAGTHPWREELHRLHGLALYQAGRQSEALDVLAAYRKRARDELGIDPGPELDDLESKILNHDSTLRRHQPSHQTLRGYQVHEVLDQCEKPEVVRRRGSQAGNDRGVVIETTTLDATHPPGEITGYIDRIDRRASLRHPTIEPVLDHWREPGAVHVVVPLYPSRLDDELLARRLDVRATVRLVDEVAAALDHAHSHGVIHGAIGERSLFSDRQGRRRLGAFPLDPGAASPIDDVVDLAGLALRSLLGSESVDRSSVESAFGATSRPREVAELLLAAREGRIHSAGELAERLRELSGLARAASVIEPSDNPYPGLAAFTELQHGDFHGREAIVDELCERWRLPSGSRLIVLTGASGSGKSSTLLAGMVPAIRRGAVPGSERWVVASMRPGADPMAALGNAMAAVATTATGDPVAALAEPGEPALRFEEAMHATIGPDRELLLVVDQFEELFSVAGADGAALFSDLLASALRAPNARVRVLASLRADWLDRPLQRQPFAGVFRESVVPLAPLTAAELQRAIMRPAEDRGVEITAALRDRLVADVVAEPGALPLLSVALHELWRARSDVGSIDLEDYDRLGGLTGALVGRAENLVDELGGSGVTELRRLFGRVVSVDPERQPVRRPSNLSEVLSAGISSETVDAAIEARLIAVDRDPDTREPMLVPTHDTLLQHWPRLVGWLQEDRSHLLDHGRLSDAADAWSRDERDPALLLRGSRLDRAVELQEAGVPLSATEVELLGASSEDRQRREAEAQTQAQRRRTLTIVACMISLVAVVAGSLAFVQSRRAEDAATTAEVRLLSQVAASVYDERPALGLQLALGAVQQSDDATVESVLVELLSRSTFDYQLDTAIGSACMAMSADPARPAVVSFTAHDPDVRSVAHRWVVPSPTPVELAGVAFPVGFCPPVSAGATHAITYDASSELRIHDLGEGTEVASIEMDRARSFGWTVDGEGVFVLHDDDGGRLELYEASSLELVQSVELDTLFVGSAQVTGLNGMAVVTSDGAPPFAIDLGSGDIRPFDDPGERIIRVATSLASDVVAGRGDTLLVAWSRADGRLLWALPHSGGERTDGPVAVSEQGAHVATSGLDGVVLVDTTTGSVIGEPLPIGGSRVVLAFAGDDDLTVAGAGDRIDVLTARRDVEVVHEGYDGGAVAPNGAFTTFDDAGIPIVVEPDGSTRTFSTVAAEHRHADSSTVVGYEAGERRFVIERDGVRAVETTLPVSENSDRGRTVRVGHGLAVQLVIDDPPDASSFRLFAFSLPDGELVAELDIPGEMIAEPVGSDRIALVRTDFSARMIELDGSTVHQFEPFGHPIESIAVAADGDLLFGLGDGSVHRFDSSTLALKQSLVGPPGAVVQILPSDGGFVTLHSAGAVVKWYDGADGPAGVLRPGAGFAGFGSISEDGTSVLMPEPGQVVRIPLDRSAFVADGCRRAGTEVDEAAWRSLTGFDPPDLEAFCADTLKQR